MIPEVSFDKNDAQFLQRIIELNFKAPRCQSAIKYCFSEVASVIIMARIAGNNNCRTQRLFWLENLESLNLCSMAQMMKFHVNRPSEELYQE